MLSALVGRMNATRLVVIAVAMVATLCLGYWGARLTDTPSRPLSSGPASYQTPTPGPTPTKAASFPDYLVASNLVDDDWSIAEWVEGSLVVAEVVVTRVDDARFNTPNGAMPTEDPSGDRSGLDAFRPVLLEVTRYWKGEGLGFDGFAVREEGGELYGFEYRGEPGPILTAGARGVAFLDVRDMTRLRQSNPRARVGHLVNLADEMGEGYGLGEIGNFYEYVGSDAVSQMNASHELVDGQWVWVPRTMPISALQAEIEAALSP